MKVFFASAVLTMALGCREPQVAGRPLQPVRFPATGPLRVLASNPRYFTDGSGRAIYLTGSHTWANFQDNGPTDPPPMFDYDAYLDSLVAWNHNFFRLWRWEQARYTAEYRSDDYWFEPHPWRRTGPGLALDGKPKFDLRRFNEAYFERLRNRVIAAGRRGIYVSIMLFNGWSIDPKLAATRIAIVNDPWKGHPFNAANNINGIDGSLAAYPSGMGTHTLLLPRVLTVQEAYVRKVVDTVNDLDNVLYEVSNESADSSIPWQYHMIDFVHRYEATKPKQHPVGMTAPYPTAPRGENVALFRSRAEWVSPGKEGGYRDDPPAADGSKVLVSDTDHLWTRGTKPSWVWKSFTRGMHTLLMDRYDGRAIGVGADTSGHPVTPDDGLRRRYMGETLTYANRMDLSRMTPRSDLASSGYCLASPAIHGAEYLVYLPAGGQVSVDLTTVKDSLAVEWLDADHGETFEAPGIAGGRWQGFWSPFRGPAVLYLHSALR